MPRGSNYRRPYPPKFRREAVQLAKSSGRPVGELAGELGISHETLRIRIVLRHARERPLETEIVRDQARGKDRDLRLHRGVLQPHQAPLHLGYLSPIDYEEKMSNEEKAA
jgi:transposase